MPDVADIHAGVAYLRAGRLQEAEAALRAVIVLHPKDADLRNHLGIALARLHREQEAAVEFAEAVRLCPDHAAALANLSTALLNTDRVNDAVVAGRKAVALRPEYAQAHAALAAGLRRQGRLAEAIEMQKKAIALGMDSPEAHNELALTFERQGKLPEALASYRRAVELAPGNAVLHSNLLFAMNYDPAMKPADLYAAHLEWAISAFGENRAGEQAIFAVGENRAVEQANSGTGEEERARVMPGIPNVSEFPSAAQLITCSPALFSTKLRIGYVSADFREHTRALFMEAVLAAHDTTAFEVFCYSGARKPDETTARIRAVADVWRETGEKSDAEVAGMIREDRIDILVELTGHMGNNRLGVFARKPAPVQVAYPGYPNTTGLSAIDYLITDEDRDPVHSVNGRSAGGSGLRLRLGLRLGEAPAPNAPGADPNLNPNPNRRHQSGGGDADSVAQASRLGPGANDDGDKSQAGRLCYEDDESVRGADLTGNGQPAPDISQLLYSEKLVRLPISSQCYRPSADSPPVGPLPAMLRGHVTFCCFNKLVKVSPGMMQAWAAILSAVSRSRLMVLAAGAGREDDDVRQVFASRGVPGDRLDLVPPARRMDYLWRYNQVDIALDTFPYNGHTTTLDGLWMGVPAVTLAGATHAAREGLAVLSLVGLAELVATTPRGYVDAAVKLARDLPRLASLRSGLRKRLTDSPLTDAARLTREIEKAYRRMWAAWCDKGGE